MSRMNVVFEEPDLTVEIWTVKPMTVVSVAESARTVLVIKCSDNGENCNKIHGVDMDDGSLVRYSKDVRVKVMPSTLTISGS
jgi:hypothetical protein